MKKVFAVLLALLLGLAACACGKERPTLPEGMKVCASRGEEFAMEEPRYLGDDDRGDPRFELNWPKVKGCDWYEVYIYSQVDGSAYRDRLTPSENSVTGTYYGYSFYDAQDNYIFGFAIQDNKLMENDGRYALDGLAGLLELDGVMLDEDWEEYWETRDAGRQEFEAGPKGDGLFQLNGYNSYLLEKNLDEAQLLSVSVRCWGICWKIGTPLCLCRYIKDGYKI